MAPAPTTLDDMIDLQHTLMDDDEQRLNALLQNVGYTIVFDDKTITVDEEHLLGGVRRVYEYKGSHRPTETYRLIENNSVEHHLDMPNSKRVAALQAEFESTPVTQELQWNGEAFIDVATGKVIDG